MLNLVCVHCFVVGKVQGVRFRAAAKKEAIQLDITGWVRNLADRRVEVLACGERGNVKKFLDWLNVGPPFARVDELLQEEIPWHEYPNFTIL